MSDGGKGSKPRPFSISHQEWSQRWDAIFGQDLEDRPNNGDQRVTAEGKLQEYREGYWITIQNLQ